jgi:hypothetical protein
MTRPLTPAERAARKAAAGNAKKHAPRDARTADYAELRAAGTAPGEASARVGVSARTGVRYELRLAASGQAPWRAAPVAPRPVPAPPAPATAAAPVSPSGQRRGCGTYLAVLLHLDLGEPLCRQCLRGEDIRRMERDAKDRLVGDEEAEANWRALDDALSACARAARKAKGLAA